MANHSLVGNVFFRKHDLNKGQSHQGHKHIIDHATLIISGSVNIEIENKSIGIYKTGDIIEIDKDKWHKLTALEDNTVYYCIFSTANFSMTAEVDNPRRPLTEETVKEILCSDCTGCYNK